MAFLKESRRKISAVTSIVGEDIVSINLNDKFITDGHSTANFERLLYIGCPVLPMEGRRIYHNKDQPSIVDANRKLTAIKICNAIHSMDKTDRTKINIFRETVSFIRMMDSEGIENFFSFDAVSQYINELVKLYKKGVKGKSISSRQNAIKSLIKELDIVLYEQCENIFTVFPADNEPTKPYTDAELKKIASALYTIFNNYAKHIEYGTTPTTFPLYNEKNEDGSFKFISNGSAIRHTTYRNSSSIWKTDLVRAAYFITCLHTGINSNPLLELKISDITEEPFQDISRGTYTLKTVKGRQSGKTNKIGAGFTKKGKIFFDRWLRISKKLNSYKDGYIFPNLSKNEPSKMTSSNASSLNKYINSFDIPSFRSQRFRKTKASLIMRATESIFMVAQGLNNSVATASKHYANGDPVTTEFSLASALYVREQTALGTPLDKAIKDSAFIFKDPIKESNADTKYKKLSNGLRCGGAFEEKSIKIKNALIKEGIANESELVACHKFLECFGCMHHAVVAEVEDIWLLLSFSDVILESITTPSINSKPTSLLHKVSNTVQVIIERMRDKHEAVYFEAYQKYLDAPHPLWQDTNDIELMLDIY
ncbi:hypothetical protein [Vreelandella neptunia]|uniref:Site-specific integrase n=1 Tax=Vreelandella neptunia TaxID=115551 RepID=A0ABZ0YTE5_9GAMM|nr:hypothetical protein [Halomonas neptunia]MDN3561612.1 hypothetical protein [Halomonas neptunia]WQH14516.1 hypothetical protein SR894_08225 [Halomonas neptunia]